MKQKIFVVQMQDSQRPSKQSYTQILDSVFFSNDTDAYLRFIPHEQDFAFTSADVVLYNRDDESLVSRPAVVKQYDGVPSVEYEMPRDLLSHWGRWQAQAVFKQGSEVYSSVIVQFDVRRYLMDERPPKLDEYESVSEFMERNQQDFDQFITAGNQALTNLTTTNEAVQQAEAGRAQAEQERVQGYQEIKQLIEDKKIDAIPADGSVTKIKLDSSLQALINDWEALMTNENESWVI